MLLKAWGEKDADLIKVEVPHSEAALEVLKGLAEGHRQAALLPDPVGKYERHDGEVRNCWYRHWKTKLWVLSNPADRSDLLRQIQFVEDARYIALCLGELLHGGSVRFSDRFIQVTASRTTEELEIYRHRLPEAPGSSLRTCTNPMYMIEPNGHWLRTHGEAGHYFAYMHGLADMLRSANVAPQV